MSTKTEEHPGGQALKQSHSSCQNCVWAKYRGQTQTDCKLGYLDVFRGRDLLVEAENEKGEFYVVNQVCRGFRPQKWAERGLSIDRLTDENRVKVSLIVLPGLPESLLATLREISQLELLPHQVFLVCTDAAADVHAAGHHILGNRVTWRMFRTTEETDFWGTLDLVVPAVAGEFYMVIEPGLAIPKDLLKKLDKAVNQSLKQFVMVEPLEYFHGLTMRTQIHKNIVNLPFDQWQEAAVDNVADMTRFFNREHPGTVQKWETL